MNRRGFLGMFAALVAAPFAALRWKPTVWPLGGFRVFQAGNQLGKTSAEEPWRGAEIDTIWIDEPPAVYGRMTATECLDAQKEFSRAFGRAMTEKIDREIMDSMG